MRFCKPFEAVFSVAVGGGMILILSGNALAAEAGSEVSSKTVNQTNSQHIVTNSSTESVSTNSVVNLVVTNDKGDVSTLSGSIEDGLGLTANDSSQGNPDAAAAVDTGKNSESAPVKPVKTLDAVTASSEQVGDRPSVVVGITGGIKSGASTPALISPQTTSSGIVIYQSTRLPIQPTITTVHVSAVEDLAADVPSAVPTQSDSKLPTGPSGSSGLLSRLSAGLAGTVVPTMFMAPFLGGLGLAVELASLLIVALLTLGLGTLSYGSRVRREGYVHAARSDVGDIVLHSIFATPLVLSYVSAPAPQHSSFLVVAETKTISVKVCNAIRKEEM